MLPGEYSECLFVVFKTVLWMTLIYELYSAYLLKFQIAYFRV